MVQMEWKDKNVKYEKIVKYWSRMLLNKETPDCFDKAHNSGEAPFSWESFLAD